MDITEDQFGLNLNAIKKNINQQQPRKIKSALNLNNSESNDNNAHKSCAQQKSKYSTKNDNNNPTIPTLITCNNDQSESTIQLFNRNSSKTTCTFIQFQHNVSNKQEILKYSEHQQLKSESISDQNIQEVKSCYYNVSNQQVVNADKEITEIPKRRPTIYRLDDVNSITATENPAENYRRLSYASTSQDLAKTRKLRLLEKMAALVTDKDSVVSVNDLPITFQVKYLGHCPAKGLWGIKNTRGPVDAMVKSAKNLLPGEILPLVKVQISTKGITLTQQSSKGIKTESEFSIETISYGVQDLIYTRVFSMIVVYENDTKNSFTMSQKEFEKQHPFECHAFVCESRNAARKLTYALAAAFQEYSKRVQQEQSDPSSPVKKKFAIDLRSPEEIQDDIDDETEA